MRLKNFFTFCVSISFLSCSQNQGTLMSGDWANDRMLLSISDSLIVFSPDFNELETFIKNDDDISIFNQNRKLRISQLDNDSIQVILIRPDSLNEIYRLGSLKKEENNVDKLRIKRIIFSSLGCFGTCPIINFEINESGACYFEGIAHTPYKGDFVAINQSNIYSLLEGKVRNLDIENLDTSYAAPWVDDSDFLLKIYYDDKVYETHVYGNYKEPIELRLLILYLTGLPNYLNLKPSSTSHHFETTERIPRHEEIKFLPPK